jgi:hypothetical protein
MKELAAHPVALRLREVEIRTARRDGVVAMVYGFLFFAAIALLVLFPFPLSRVGSVVLIVGFGYMIWRCKHVAARQRMSGTGDLLDVGQKLDLVDRQIELAQSMLFNVPFFVGANLFWMGLPGTGTVLEKAVLDFIFLGGTLSVFAASYVFNQRLIRKEMIPLRNQLKALMDVRGETPAS